jgi:excisionase family DNA binding protein
MRQQAMLAPLDVLRRYKLEDAAAYLGIGRTRLYKRIKDGEVTVIKDGKCTLVPGAEIARLCAVPAKAD